jgi:hypothetical protein
VKTTIVKKNQRGKNWSTLAYSGNVLSDNVRD